MATNSQQRIKYISALVGMKYRTTPTFDAVRFVASLPMGEPLTLVREPENKFDPNAVQVWARGIHVGYVAAGQARGLVRRASLPDVARLVSDGGSPAIETEE